MSNPPPMNPEFKPHQYVEEDGVPDFHAQTKDPTSRQFAGAAVAAGVAGTVIAGPVVGIAAAGAAALATTAPGKGGDIVRAGGEATAKVGDKMKAIDEKHHLKDKAKAGAKKGLGKAKATNEKHHITDKAKASMSKGLQKAKEIDQQHGLSGKAKKGLSKGFKAAREADKKHNFSGKAAKGVVKGATWVAKKAANTK